MIGRLLVVWGAIGPMLIFLLCRGYVPGYGLVGSIEHMSFWIGETEFPFSLVVAQGLVMIGAGLSINRLRF
jgi:hypothetical protein